MTDELFDQIAEIIKTSRFFARYGYKYRWISGCSTEVYPITLWYPSKEICVQVETYNMQGIHKSAEALVKKLSGLIEITDHYLCKNDGSCPNEYRIYYK